jgi:hypothetical protein
MLRRRYEILLPLQHNDGRPVSDVKFDQTREELLARFEGLSWTLHPVQGAWVHAGIRYEDVSTRIMVDVDDTPENRQFFVDFKPVLRERFEQIEIYIFSYPIDVV